MLSDFYNLLLYTVNNQQLITLLMLLSVICSIYLLTRIRYNKKLQLQKKLFMNNGEITNNTHTTKPFDRNYIPEYHATHNTTFTIDSVSQSI